MPAADSGSEDDAVDEDQTPDVEVEPAKLFATPPGFPGERCLAVRDESATESRSKFEQDQI